MSLLPRLLLLVNLASASLLPLPGAERRVHLIAGPPSHGPGQHEHNAGVLLLQKCLAGVPGLRADVTLGQWPADPSALATADAIILFMDGGARHLALQGDNLAALGAAMRRGAGLGLLHFAVEPTREKGQPEFIDWVGAAFEIHWSVNPHWDAQFTRLPDHPVTRGVKPFTIRDEWYFHLRFAPGQPGVTPLLVAVPDASTVSRPDGAHSGNPAMRAAVARGEPQTVAWVRERPDGGRGFGFTGAHYHANWAQPDFRRLVLNAIVWLAHAEVPAGGVASEPTAAELSANLDPKPAAKKGPKAK